MRAFLKSTELEIKEAATALKAGHLVAFPTETVYGLGADATNQQAVNRIYSVKGRPSNHPLIVHISSIKSLKKWATNISGYALALAEEFWPGPMTLILEKDVLVKDFVTSGQKNIGIRVPSNSIALRLLIEFETLGGIGVAAPSANRFGAVSPTTASAVDSELGLFLNEKDLIIDGGQSNIGLESTIIDCTGPIPIILRPGALTGGMIRKKVGKYSIFNVNRIKASGLIASHYSPNAKVILGDFANPGEGFLALSNIPTPLGAIRLSSPENLESYAKNLYAALRFADQQGINVIVAKPPEGCGLAEAIKDRLIKASMR